MLTFSVFISETKAANPYVANLVLDLDMTLEGSTVYDKSTYKNNATIYGGINASGGYSYAVSFDGVDDYGEVLHDASITPGTAFTLRAWMNITDVIETDDYGRYGRIIDKNLHYALGVRMGIVEVSSNKTASFSGMNAHQGVTWDYDLDQLLMVSTDYMTLWDFNGTLLLNQTLVKPPDCTKGNAPCYFNGSYYVPMTNYPTFPGNCSVVEYNATDLTNLANYTIIGIPQNISLISCIGRNDTNWYLGTGPFYGERVTQGRSHIYRFDNSFSYTGFLINTTKSAMQGLYFPDLNSSTWFWNGYGVFYKYNNDTMRNVETDLLTEGFFISDDWEYWISDDHKQLTVYVNETLADIHFSPRLGYHYYAERNLTLNEWHEIIGTFNETTDTVNIYLNQTLVYTATLTQPTSDWYSNNLSIGYAPYYHGANFSGTIDKIQVYDTDIPNIWDYPESELVTISNMEGCGNWVFAEEKYYTFKARYWDGNGYADLDQCRLLFTDGLSLVHVAYNRAEDEYVLFAGEDVVNLKAGTATALDANFLQVTFLIYFKNTILDADNVDIYLWCNDTQGEIDTWQIVASDYFNIYSLGGHATYETSGDAGRIPGGDVFDLYAESNISDSWVEANLTFRNLQHIKLLPMLIFNTSSADFNIQYTINYCVDHKWYQGLTLRLDLLGVESGANRHAAFTCIGQYGISFSTEWYQHGGYFKTDTAYMYHTANADQWSTTRFWIDLWFNKINASTTMGTRINAYYYPMTDSSSVWLRWLTGSNWGINETVSKQFMAFNNIEFPNGTIISTKQIDLVRVQCRLETHLQAGNKYQRIELRDHDVFDITIGTEPFTGIQTPVFDETKVPVMPQGGFLGTLASMFLNGLKNFAEFMGPHLLNFFYIFADFLDTIAASVGLPTVFTTLLDYLVIFWEWFVDSLAYLVTLLGTLFETVLGPVMAKFLNLLISVFTQWMNMITTFLHFLDGAYTGGLNLWNDLNLATWIMIGAILYPLYLVFLWEERGMEAVIAQLTFIKDIVYTLVHSFLAMAQWFIDLIGRIIESIPIVE